MPRQRRLGCAARVFSDSGMPTRTGRWQCKGFRRHLLSESLQVSDGDFRFSGTVNRGAGNAHFPANERAALWCAGGEHGCPWGGCRLRRAAEAGLPSFSSGLALVTTGGCFGNAGRASGCRSKPGSYIPDGGRDSRHAAIRRRCRRKRRGQCASSGACRRNGGVP